MHFAENFKNIQVLYYIMPCYLENYSYTNQKLKDWYATCSSILITIPKLYCKNSYNF